MRRNIYKVSTLTKVPIYKHYDRIHDSWFLIIEQHIMGKWYLNLNHWGWVTHICSSKLTIIGSDNGLSPGRHQAIIWTNAGILLIGPLGTNFDEILIEIHTFSFKKMHLKMSSAKQRLYCLGFNVFRWVWEGNSILQQPLGITSARFMDYLCSTSSKVVYLHPRDITEHIVSCAI